MSEWILVWLLLTAGCSSGGGGNGATADLAVLPDLAKSSGWTLTGTMAGFNLQNEAVSGEAHVVNTTSALVQLSSRGDVCGLLQQNACPSGRLLGFRLGGTATGTYTVAAKDPPGAGQARIYFLDLDAQCLENAMVSATSGTLTVTASDLTGGGGISFSFDAQTPDGPISGQVRAPFCQI
jgi:hypothetical protein